MSKVTTTINQFKQSKQKTGGLLPMIFAVGKSELELGGNYFVNIDDHNYEFRNLLEAVTFCFKQNFVFGSGWHYQKECFQVWRFIEKYFFEIPSKWENKFIEKLIRLL